MLSVLGPLANSLGAVTTFMKTVVSQKPWLKDPLAVRKPWNEEEYGLVEHGHGKNLCFGILWDDEHIVPHPPVRRGLEEAKQALIAAGHKGQDSFLLFCIFLIFVLVIDWKPLKHIEICKAVVSALPDSMRSSSVSLIISSNHRVRSGQQPQGRTTASPPCHLANLLSQP